jgi:hypothetical protein
MWRIINMLLVAIILSLSANGMTHAGIMSGPGGLPLSMGPLKAISGANRGYGHPSNEYARGNVAQRQRVPTRLVRTKIAPNSQGPSAGMSRAYSAPTHNRRQIMNWPNRL